VADSSALPADDSLLLVPPDADSALADFDQAGFDQAGSQQAGSAQPDFPDDSPSDYQAQVVQGVQHSAERQDAPWSPSPVFPLALP
jgi:hypothetical protein